MPAVRLGVPDTSQTILRSNLIDLMSQALEPVVTVVAPSGYGKTIAAAQFVQSHGGNSLWLRLQGQTASAELLLGLASGVIERCSGGAGMRSRQPDDPITDVRGLLASLSANPFLIVLDDYSGSDLGSLTSEPNSLLEVLQPFVSRVIVTTRQQASSNLVAARTAWVDRSQLVFDSDEIRRLAEKMGSPLSPGDADRVVSVTGGHPALAQIFISHGELIESSSRASESLSAKSAVARLLQSHVPEHLVPALESAAMLKECTLHDLREMGCVREVSEFLRLAEELPLVSVHQPATGAPSVFVHDLVAEHLLRRENMSSAGRKLVGEVIGCLVRRGDWARIEFIAMAFASDADRLEIVERFGSRMLADSRTDVLLTLIDSISLRQLMGSARALLVWAQAMRAVGRIEDEQAKARAAARLAAHEGDADTTCMAIAAQMLGATEQGRSGEALSLEESLRPSFWNRASDKVKIEVLYRRAYALMALGQADEALDALDHAQRLLSAGGWGRGDSIGHRLDRAQSVTRFFRDGDVTRLVTEHARMLSGSISAFDRAIVKGNLAGGVVEMGRLSRAESLLQGVADSENTVLRATYLPTWGLVAAARGDYADALKLIARGAEAAAELGYEGDLNQHLTFQSCIERAAARPEASLVSAERSFEVLSSLGWFGYACLAAAEVAASLLMLGDEAGAGQWLTSAHAMANKNSYYHVTVDSLRAVCLARAGREDEAATVLARHSSLIRREAANWRLAMYCRTFPELLGLLALAVGVERLPSHMLRMVLPENAEVSLRATQSFMPADEWNQLGRRVLGTEQFCDFTERRGQPICRVRLFGGLEVTVGDRVVRERDWTKRKGRLLFTILVAEGGAEVPRDKLLEHLWPDLDEERAKNNFYVAWSTMKSALLAPEERGRECPYVESLRGRCRVITDKLRSDVAEFDDLIRKARVADAEGRGRDAIALYSDLMTVYRGDLLPGDAYDDWFSTLRDGYRREFVDGMLRAVEILLEFDDPCEAVLFARRGMSVDPTREDLYQAALRSHIAAGQRSSAIDTFIQCKTKLAEELGLDPSMDTIRLYEQVLVMEEKPRYHPYDEAE